MKKAGEERTQATDFREAVCCPSTVVQGTARQKNGLRGVPGVTGTLGKANSNFDPAQTGPHHHVEAAVDWCSCFHVVTLTYIAKPLWTQFGNIFGQ